MRDQADFVFDVFDVVGDAAGFLFGDQSFLQFFIMRGDAGGAGVLVALQRLNAAQREHEAARAGDEVRADAQRPGDFRRDNQLAGSDHLDALAQAVFHQRVHHHRQAFAHRHADIINQTGGRGAGAAVGAVDRDEVGRVFMAAFADVLAQFANPGFVANHRLEADRLAGDLADVMHHVEQVVIAFDFGVAVGADGVCAHRDAANA